MKEKKIIPKIFGKKQEIARREDHPFFSLQREMNRVFDDFFHGWDLQPFRWGGGFDTFQGAAPKVDVSETDDFVRVEADVPGLDEKDIDVTLSNNVLTISGEKKEEREEKKKDFYRVERSYGSFKRAIPIRAEVDPAKIKATLKKGVLKIELPKTPAAKKDVKRITVSGE